MSFCSLFLFLFLFLLHVYHLMHSTFILYECIMGVTGGFVYYHRLVLLHLHSLCEHTFCHRRASHLHCIVTNTVFRFVFLSISPCFEDSNPSIHSHFFLHRSCLSPPCSIIGPIASLPGNSNADVNSKRHQYLQITNVALVNGNDKRGRNAVSRTSTTTIFTYIYCLNSKVFIACVV